MPEKTENVQRKHAKNWKDREYYVVNQETGDVVAESFKNEKQCREWIASEATQFNVPYVVCYRVQAVAPVTKVQKTILK